MNKIVRLLIATSGTFTFLTNILCGISLAEDTQSELNFKKYDFWVEKCRFLKDNQQFSEALSACEQAISLKPKKDNIQLWLARGDLLLKLNQYSEAVVSYDWVLQEDKKNVPALAQKCQALLGLGNYEGALESCDLALERRDNWQNLKQVKKYWGNIPLAKVLYIKASVLRRQKNYDEAITLFDDALKQDDNFALAEAGKCGVLADQKMYNEASQLCQAAVQKFENPQSINEQAQEQADEQKNQNTINTPEETDTSNAIIWYETGRVSQKLGEAQTALNYFNRAIQINPKYSQALARKSEILNQMGRYQEALQECESALKGDNQWSDTKGLAYVWYQRSAALLGLQKYQEALASSEKAIAIDQKYAEAWNNKAVSLWKLGQYEAAEKAIHKAVLYYPGSYYAQGYANRGRILSSLNQYEDAILAYEYASTNIENLDRKSLHVFWLNKAVAEMHLNDYQAALKSVNWSMKEKESFAAFYNKAIILSRLGDYENAIKSFDKANEFLPDNHLVLTGKAIALMNTGEIKNYEDAKSTFHNALKIIDRALRVKPSYSLAIQKRKELITKMQENVEKYMKVRHQLE
ncbi:MAG: tetratricopeptide repeat protein [Rivularia sp. (in: Bacteria)]|nr:tetratricopeptide repeat protein [Rivularia sp. MS3]